VVAPKGDEAERFHEDAEGYDPGEARAALVAPVPEGAAAETGWPSEEALERCGATFVRRETPRVVEIGGRHFAEGMLEHELRTKDDDGFEARGEQRPNGTERRRAM
jgi:hypothetical protein